MPRWHWPTRPRAWPGPCCVTTQTTIRTWPSAEPDLRRRSSTAIAEQTAGWQTGRTGVGQPRECPSNSITKKRLGADARIAHYGPASTYADYRGRIYVRSRATLAFSNLLAMRRSPYTDGKGTIYARLDRTCKQRQVPPLSTSQYRFSGRRRSSVHSQIVAA